jgi:hypothetical protein
VEGYRKMTYELTPDAVELGLHAALPEVFRLDFGEFGRGERISPDTTSPVLMITVTNVPTCVHRVAEIA